MSTIAEIKSATEKLSLHDRVELLRWLAARDDIARRQRDDLLADIDAGLGEADRGELLPGAAVIQQLKGMHPATLNAQHSTLNFQIGFGHLNVES